jgi:TolB-like protein/DNA-binding winged helix-turn-helix (wHTH) protein/Tfp pilus assembly protein PilF
MSVDADSSGVVPGGAAIAARSYEFGPYRVERSTRQLLRNGTPVPLTPKAFEVLLALVERRGRVVGKDQLMTLVWRDSFVEEANLSQTIFVLRKTLGDAPDGRPYIDTVPRRGYRFASVVTEEPARLPEGREAAPAGRLRHRTSWIAAAVILAAVVWSAASWRRSPIDTPARVESLVVLPFVDLTGGSEPSALADSLTDALITKLGQIGGLRVISRTSAMTYRDSGKTVPQIARELSVAAVVEGTLQRSADRVQLNVKLIDASSDRTLWAQSYEHDRQYALDLHNQMARAIVGHTSVTLTPGERQRLAATTRVNPKAYEAYLTGRYFWNLRTEPDMRRAIEHFEEAIRHDPGYAPAYAGLADSYALHGSYGWNLPGANAWTRAIAAAEKALAVDDTVADGHTSRARIALNYELDWSATAEGYRRALSVNPGYANAHHWYGYYLLLVGRLEEGEAEIRRALELDPLSPIINANAGMAAYFNRQYDEALAHWRRALEMHRNHRVLHLYVATGYLGKRMYPEAAAELEKTTRLSGTDSWGTALLVHTYGRMGRSQEARALLSTLLREGDAAAYQIALAYVGLGDADEAFAWLNRSVDTRMGSFNEVHADPIFDPLRTDPRFAALLERMRFPG